MARRRARSWWRGEVETTSPHHLSAFAFEEQGADFVFGCDVADYNAGSLRAFQKAGYTIDAEIEQPEGSKAHVCYDLVLPRTRHLESKAAQ